MITSIENTYQVYLEVNWIFNILHLSGLYHHCQPFLSGINHFQPFSYFRAFSNIFSNILMPLCRVYFGIQRNVGLRNKRGCFSIRQNTRAWKFVNLSPDNHEAEIVLDKRSEKFASFDCTFNFFSRMKKSVPKCLRTLQCSFNLCGKLTFIKVYFICCIRGCALIWKAV